MRNKYLLKIVVVFLSVFLVACQQNNSKSNSNSTVGLYGTVITIDKEKRRIELDITVWSREVGDLSTEDDVGAVKVIEVKENTLIKYENEKTAKLADIHENQKVEVVETAAGDIKELIIKN